MDIAEVEGDDFSDDTDYNDIVESNSVFVSVLQIYNENISDLIQAKTLGTSQNLKVRQDKLGNFYVSNLK